MSDIKNINIDLKVSGMDVYILGLLNFNEVSVIYPTLIGLFMLIVYGRKERYTYLIKEKSRSDLIFYYDIIGLFF